MWTNRWNGSDTGYFFQKQEPLTPSYQVPVAEKIMQYVLPHVGQGKRYGESHK